MALKKFGPKDVLLNTMKTHPRCEFFVFDSSIYYNNIPHVSGAITASLNGIPAGYVSLYEENIDRMSGSTDRFIGCAFLDSEDGVYVPSTIVDNGMIYPWITKDGSGQTFNRIHTASNQNYYVNYEYGDVISSSYPMSASITRELMGTMAGELMTGDFSLLPTNDTSQPRLAYTGVSTEQKCSEAVLGEENDGFSSVDTTGGPGIVCNKPKYRHYWALKPALDSYGYLSEHYKVTASVNEGIVYKDQQEINMISIPSIFYGSRIKPGTVSLKWYFTGSLAGELRDTRRNGELIQVTGSDYSVNNDKVAGVVLYNEGFILLTGSWALNDETLPIVKGDGTAYAPSWKFFGAGANDGVSQATTGQNFYNASFVLSFKGTTEVQTLTMFANAQRGKVNYSNNPTYLNYSSSVDSDGNADPSVWVTTSSLVFEENPERTIVNFVSSSASDYSASFERQVYISRVGIYDDNKNLIGVATLSNPVRKAEDEDLTFKIKLDI